MDEEIVAVLHECIYSLQGLPQDKSNYYTVMLCLLDCKIPLLLRITTFISLTKGENISKIQFTVSVGHGINVLFFLFPFISRQLHSEK